MRFYVLFTQRGVLICKHGLLDEQQLLLSVGDCVAYLGPLVSSSAADYLAECHPDLWPTAEEQFAQLATSVELYRLLTFKTERSAQ